MATTSSDLIRQTRFAAGRLAELDIAGQMFRAWTGEHVLETLDGRLWQPVGALGQISEITRDEDLASTQVQIGIRSAADGYELDRYAFDQAVNEQVQSDIYNRDITTLLQCFDLESGTLVGPPVVEFIGLMSHWTVRREAGGAVNIAVVAENLFAEGIKPSHALYTDADQRARFPGDLGLEYIATNADRVLTWPRD